jgi:23S rRNA pseudouridine1911/1915/1917 synthase
MEEIVIIYEDDDIAAVNKPAGLIVHADGRTSEETLVDWILKRYPEMRGVGEPLTLAGGTVIDRPGVVHRLDRSTSGVLVLAKTRQAFEHLKQQFQERTVEKTYNAFVYGALGKREGVVDLPIGRSQSDFRRWSAERDAREPLRAAETRYTVLKAGDEASFLELSLKTGRTHQVRVHMRALGHPVVCDARYAPNRPCILGFKRLALHARLLSLSLLSQARVTLEAALPKDFESALDKIG